MEDSVAETVEVTKAVANAFQDFGFVVAALGIAVSKRNNKGVKDQLAPVVNRSGTVSEFRQMRGFGAVDQSAGNSSATWEFGEFIRNRAIRGRFSD